MRPIFLQTESTTTSLTPALLGIGVIVVLGFLSVYLLLPRVRRFTPIWGGALAGVTLLLIGLWLIQSSSLVVESILFYAFSGIAVVFGGLMITQTKPVRAALSFAMVVLSSCGLFLLQAAPFLMASTIIIYAGAIVVTFLLVIMLAQQSGLDNADYRSREPFLATLAGFVFLGAVSLLLMKTYNAGNDSLNTFYKNSLNQLQGEMAKVRQAQKMPPGAERKELLVQDKEPLEELGQLVKTIKTELKPTETPQPLELDKNQQSILKNVQELERAINNLQVPWIMENEEEIQVNLNIVAKKGKILENSLYQKVIDNYSLSPPEKKTLSTMSGTPANQRPQLDKTGRPRMPADNVAAIGKSLFTDYLLAVELVAVLLLVATIGAIAIAGRQSETLR